MDINQTSGKYPVELVNIGNLAESFLKIYASLLLIVGIPGNIVCGIIMGGNKANRLTTRLLMVILSIADSAVLLTAVLRYWSIKIFDWDPRTEGAIPCKLHVFAVAFSTDFAVGSLCAIALERLLVVAFPHKANSVVTVTSVILGMTSFGLLIAVKNLIHFWMMGSNEVIPVAENYTITKPGASDEKITYQFRCASDPSYRTLFRLFMKIDLVSFAVLPYIILFSSNVYIYLKLRKQQSLLKRNKQRTQNVSQITIRAPTQPYLPTAPDRAVPVRQEGVPCLGSMHSVPKRVKRRPESAIKLLTALTLIHVGCTLPGTIFTFLTSYFTNYFENMNKDTHELVKVSLVMLIFTNNAINFFGYYISCASFRETFRSMVFSLCQCSPQSVDPDNRNECRSAYIFRCCTSSVQSNQPDRVLIVAPKPCAPTNSDQVAIRQTTHAASEPIEE